MGKILGLDLGTNSIGWAVVEPDNSEILGTGVRVFPMGVENLATQKETPKNATRRQHRQTRRQYFRKKLRKIKLLELLIKYDMCSLNEEELQQWKHYDKREGKAGMQFPSTKKFNDWLKLNPYRLRAEGLERNLTKQEFGRVLYHLIQRRGFWSNRKVKDDGTISKGKGNVLGIKHTQEKLKDYETLGSFLYHISHKDGEKFRRLTDEDGKELRVRARYTLRQMYIDEFEKLWERQANQLGLDKIIETQTNTYLIGNPYKKGSKDNGLKKKLAHRLEYLKSKGIKAELTNETDPKNTKLIVEKDIPLKEMLGGGDIIKQEDSVLFWQRPLRIQKFLLDECSFERTIWKQNDSLIYQRKKPSNNAKLIYAGKKPCPVSHPLSELRRAYEFINNIEYGDRVKLNEDQRKVVLDLINSKDAHFDFEFIPKALKLQHEKFNYDKKHKVPGNPTHKQLKPLFKKEIWENHAEDIWHCFHFYGDSKMLFEKLCNDYGLNSKHEDKIRGKVQDDGTRKGGIKLEEGYSNLSLKAIKNILPFLERGYVYSTAVLLGGVKNAFGHRWNYFEQYHSEIEKNVAAIAKDKHNQEGEAIKKIKNYLANNDFGFESEDQSFIRLYHHSQDTERQTIRDKLDEPENIRNPLVQQALYEVRGLVNTLTEEYLDDGEKFDQIKVEMARELKQPKQKRMNLTNQNKQRENENEKARAALDEFGLSHSRVNIHKYLLWDELRHEGGNAICPYTGNTISIAELFNDNKYQIEHIVPYSKSLDDSFANKTICNAEENGRKGEKTPFQFYGNDEKKWEEVKNRAFRVLPYQKAKRFTSKESHQTDFISRQLNDTRYISRAAKDYLKQICPHVRVLPGQLTADLRTKWGLDNILSPPVEANDETNLGRVWAQFNGNGEPIAFYPIYNKKPKYEKGEFVITGEVQDGKFSSKYLAVSFETNGFSDGHYWAKMNVSKTPEKLVSVLRPKPKMEIDDVLLYGQTDKKGVYSSKYLNQTISGNTLEGETPYWAKLKVLTDKTSFFNTKNKKTPKPKNNNILVFGEVKDGIFSSKIYSCDAEVEDGKYNALLEVDLESITFHAVKNKKPETNKNQIRVTGNVSKENFQPNIARKHFYYASGAQDGLHWAVFELQSDPQNLTLIENTQPKIDDGELIEGTLALKKVIQANEETGEVLREEERKFFFPDKQRGDHRHHAIDALVVALTEQGFLQRLSTYNANREEKRRGNKYNKARLDFPMPWQTFLEDVTSHIEQILVSHKMTDKVLTKKKTLDPKSGKENEGIGARGQLHDQTYYGKRCAREYNNKYFHKRESIETISKIEPTGKSAKAIDAIVDLGVRRSIYKRLLNMEFNNNNQKLKAIFKAKIRLLDITRIKQKEWASNKKKVEEEKNELITFLNSNENQKLIKNFSIPPNTFFDYPAGLNEEEKNNQEKQPMVFMPNNKGGQPVPIKKVRILRTFKTAKQLNENAKIHYQTKDKQAEINRYVEPNNNHHILIYKDENGNLQEEVVTFWAAAKRKKQNQPIVQLPKPRYGEPKPVEIIATLQENDMFLMGVNEPDITNANQSILSEHLFRVQKISECDYTFRHHLASTLENPEEKLRIRNLQNFQEYNPVKVRVTRTGKIQIPSKEKVQSHFPEEEHGQLLNQRG